MGAGTSLLVISVVNREQSTASDKLTTLSKSQHSQTVAIPTAYVPGLPIRIVIPKINVSAPIDSMGLTANGDLDAPKNILNAGWYSSGPRAGSPGSAVVDGHFGGTKNNPAVFDDLHLVTAGDTIQIIDSAERTHTFIVKDTRVFQPEDDATAVFSSDDKKPHLNLITCQGQWINSKQSYTSRLIVFSDLLTE